MASYQRSIRFATDHKQNISVAGSALQFTWHILIAGMYFLLKEEFLHQ
jgi:hypothetical protein